jgi:hypothetical protein
MTPMCDHRRGMGRTRSSAITVCRNCRDFICSICGLTIEWYEGLCVTNPPVQWRYCEKPACVEVEAAYHGYPIDEMIQHRNALCAKRLQPLRRLPRPPYTGTILPSLPRLQSGPVQSRPERINFTPLPFKLDPGEACWCNRGKDCDGSHEIFIGAPIHVCGLCGKTFEISDDDPHWSTGRGPICPDREAS